MAVQTVLFSAVSRVYSEIYATSGRALIETFVSWSYTGNKSLLVALVAENSTDAMIDVNNIIQIDPNTTGQFSEKFRYMALKSETSDLPTLGLLTFYAVDNTMGIASKALQSYSTDGSKYTVPFSSYGLLPVIAVDGAEALVSKLVGAGYFGVRYMTSTSRWGVIPGQCIASQNDPHSVVTASGTSAVDVTWLTIPAGIIGDGEEWELSTPVETGTNTGSDVVAVIIGSTGVMASGVATATTSPFIFRFDRTGTIFERLLQITGSSISLGIQRSSIDGAASQTVKLRITPATIGNTCYIRRAVLRRLS